MILRAAGPDDAAALADLYAPYVTASFISFEMEPPDAPEMRRRIEGGSGLFPWLLAEEAGEVLGYAYAGAFRPRPAYRFAVETTVYVRNGLHRQGLGTRLYGPLLRVLADQGFTQAIGAISLPNEASVRLHERLGFRRAGVYRDVGYKFGRWHDVGLWQRALAPLRAPAAEAKPLATVGWPAAYLE
ncbi:MAG TPA: GNAT family N-acetyltransferase [Allosphingosinicella sp.]